MKKKQIIKNITISIIIGIILGSITEIALILNISWLIRITQSFMFWGIVICICAFISKDYILSLTNSSLIITIIFSYDENVKSSNNKGFLLQTI